MSHGPMVVVYEFKAVAPKCTEERSALLSKDVTIMSPAEKAQQPVIGISMWRCWNQSQLFWRQWCAFCTVDRPTMSPYRTSFAPVFVLFINTCCSDSVSFELAVVAVCFLMIMMMMMMVVLLLRHVAAVVVRWWWLVVVCGRWYVVGGGRWWRQSMGNIFQSLGWVVSTHHFLPVALDPRRYPILLHIFIYYNWAKV